MPSSVIRHFDYHSAERELIVDFVTGPRYIYVGVPEAEVAAFRVAFSKGRYFNARIRDHYPCREVPRGVYELNT